MPTIDTPKPTTHEDFGMNATVPMVAISSKDMSPEPDPDLRKTGPMPTVPDPQTSSVRMHTGSAALETPTSAIFKAENRKALLAKLEIPTKDRTIERPSKREVCYLIVDAITLNDSKAQKILSEEVKIVAEAGDFYVNTDSDGNLVIMALSERGGVEKLVDIERSLHSQIANVKMLLNIDHVEHIQAEDQFNLKNYPESNETAKWRKPSSLPTQKTTIKKALADRIKNPDSRIGSNLSIITSDTDNPDDLYLIDAIQKVSEEQGGPDTLVGYETELATLLEYVTDEETALIILEGEAWKGKSRLRTELCKKITSKIVCSANPSDANVLGSTLVSLAKQLYGALIEDEMFRTLTDEEVRIDGQESSLAKFMKLGHADQITFAVMYPDMISEICSEALGKLNQKKDPNTLLIIEDIHHVDRLSLPFLKDIIKNYHKQTGGKTMITTRPEETDNSTVLQDLVAETKAENEGKKAVKTLSLKQGLNFTKRPELATKFAFHSLPFEKRKKNNGEPKKLGDWPQKIARLAGNTPGYFKALMDIVKEHLIYGEETIDIPDDFARELDSIKPEDLETYLNERVNRLPDLQLTILQCLSLFEEPIPPIIIILLAGEFVEFTGTLDSEDIINVFKPLTSGGYLIEKKDTEGILYNFQHENMFRIVSNAIPKDKKIKLAKIARAIVKDNPTIRLTAKHNLETFIANQQQEGAQGELRFWDDYKELTFKVFEEISGQNDSEHMYKVCGTILNIPRIQSSLSRLTLGEMTASSSIEALIKKTLTLQAEAARFLGKFEEVDQLVKTLRSIASLPEIEMVAFEKAYTVSNVEEMKTIFQAISENAKLKPTEAQRAMMEIKIAYKENNFTKVEILYERYKSCLEHLNLEHLEKYGAPSPIYLETIRIATLRSPFEEIRTGAENRDGVIKFDTDVVRQPISLTKVQNKRIKDLAIEIEQFHKSTKKRPLSLDRYGEFGVMDQIAETTAFSGNTNEAIRLYGECWRLAKQMQLHDRAARATVYKGDLYLLKAINPDSRLNQEETIATLRKAIDTYSENSCEEKTRSFNKLDRKDQYQLILRAQRIRAISILARSSKLLTQEEVHHLVKLALEDFAYINKEFASQANDPEILYYIMGSMGNIIATAEKENIPGIDFEGLFDEKQNPFMNIKKLNGAIKFGENNVTDLGLGEVERKIEGLYVVANIVDQRKKALKKQARSASVDSSSESVIKRELLVRLERLESISELVKDQAILPVDKRIKPETLKMHLETAVQDFRYLGLQDASRHLPEENYSLEEIQKAADTLGIDLTPYKTATLGEVTVSSQNVEKELQTLNNLVSIYKQGIRRNKQENRRRRDAELLAKQAKAA